MASVLHGLGREAIVTGLAGGLTGAAARAELKAAGLRDQFGEITGELCVTMTVVGLEGCAHGGLGAWACCGPEGMGAARSRCSELIDSAPVAVLSGSLPPGLSGSAYAQLIRLANAIGVPAVLDAQGEALALGAAARPAVVNVNASELASATGADEVKAGARATEQWRRADRGYHRRSRWLDVLPSSGDPACGRS